MWVSIYRRERSRINPNAAELGYDDHELLTALGCARQTENGPQLTVAGLLLFGKGSALRRVMPLVRVDYIRIAGREWVPSGESRYETAVEMRGSLLTLLPRAQAAIMDDLPRAFNLPEGALQRTDQPRLPLRVVREALVNALMHASYREQQPTQVLRFANRLEMRNPGFSLKAEDRLGEPGSQPRNPFVAAVMHELNFAETKGTGIRTMRVEMEGAGLTPPHFDSDRDANAFTATFLFHHFLTEDDVRWLGQFQDLALSDEDRKALVFLRETGRIDNRTYRDLTKAHPADATAALRRLRELNLIEARDRTSARYYVPSGRLLAATPGAASSGLGIRRFSGIEDKTRTSITDKQPTIADKVGGMSDTDSSEETIAGTVNAQNVPPQIGSVLRALGRRADPESVKTAIVSLCAWRPLAAREIAEWIGRSRRYTWQLIQVLEHEGRLAPTRPETPRHPEQTYRAIR